jgi:hypothetical protein
MAALSDPAAYRASKTVCGECGRKKVREMRPKHLLGFQQGRVLPDICLINQGYLCSALRRGAAAARPARGRAFPCVGCRWAVGRLHREGVGGVVCQHQKVFAAMTDIPPDEVSVRCVRRTWRCSSSSLRITRARPPEREGVVMTTLTFPLSRIEGHAQVVIEVQDGQVVAARFQATELRGFDYLVRGAPAEQMPVIVPRICGVCSTAHHVAAVRALEDAFGVTRRRRADHRELLMLGQLLQTRRLSGFFSRAGSDETWTDLLEWKRRCGSGGVLDGDGLRVARAAAWSI